MWRNSHEQDVFNGLDLLEQSGWIRCEDATTWTIDWDSLQLQRRVQDTINFLTKGCSCKKGGCKGMTCGCRTKGNTCGPGCNCHGCTNVPVEEVRCEDSDTDSDDDEPGNDLSDEYDSEQSGDEQTGPMEAEIVTEEFDFLLMDSPGTLFLCSSISPQLILLFICT